MDPAPDPDSTLTMPSPARTVTRSVTMLVNLGWARHDALRMIMHAARHAWADLQSIDVGDLSWLEAIWRDAEARLGSAPPQSRNAKETDHGGSTQEKRGEG